ncbi:unnamed protein product [Angiostrongylus costaricensis]|uniref:Clr2 domain-containing protein n=1 Tax=Angiostrongylus costaricensis TaxID=334426 RepID=A0A0R3Q1S9_ANGCS|nr:unnamed protein product [Angiostrongylus costaricensis]
MPENVGYNVEVASSDDEEFEKDLLTYHRANLSMNDAYAEVILKNNRRMDEEQWKQHIFNELKATFLAEDLKLPVRLMLGVITWRGGGYMVYSGAPGRYLQHFLQENVHSMSCWTKIKV